MTKDTGSILRELAKTIDTKLNGIDAAPERLSKPNSRENGFVLLVFPFGAEEGRRTNYVSNGERRDIVTALKEIVARFEGQPEISGTA